MTLSKFLAWVLVGLSFPLIIFTQLLPLLFDVTSKQAFLFFTVQYFLPYVPAALGFFWLYQIRDAEDKKKEKELGVVK